MNEALALTQADRLVEELRASYRRIQTQQQEAWKKHADTLPESRIWLANVVRPVRRNLQNALEVVRAVYKYGALIAARKGVSIGTQILQQLRLYQKHRVPADCYYFLGLYEEQARRKARFFLSDASTSTLLHRLATTAPEEEYAPLHNKFSFWSHCRNHDLSTVPVLAVFKGGSLQKNLAGIRDTLPTIDLFSKPVTGYLGRGARRWKAVDDGHFTDGTGHTYTQDAMLDSLKRQSEEGTILLQPSVCDHPLLEELIGSKGPSTLQIVTIRKPGASPEYLAGFLTTPVKEVPAPTFKGQTALAARVHAKSGTLGRPLFKQAAYLLNDTKKHPRTGRRLTGFELPYWDEARALALQAHETLPNIACVGWDVMLTPDGPQLLEGNYDCSAALTQITHQQFLGLSRFPEYLNAHLQEANV